MARYKFHQRSYFNDRLWEKGEEIDLSDSIKPGPHMEPIDDAAKAAAAAGGIKFTGEVPDVLGSLLPIYEDALSKNRKDAEKLTPEALKGAFAEALASVFGNGSAKPTQAEIDALVAKGVADELARIKAADADPKPSEGKKGGKSAADILKD